MTAYYNEIDPQKAAWLRELIRRDLIAPGDVDERSIADVRPADLRSYTQCHFFAGIGTWSYALRLAGWPDNREAWTGSCPCQPFSAAGQRKAFHDERHLWPAWFLLIEARRPLVCFGEQVASYDGLAWLDLVHSDLDRAGYTCGAVDLCAAGLGAPHRRQRLYWVADSAEARRDCPRQHACRRSLLPARSEQCSDNGFVAHSATLGHDGRGAGEAERRAGKSERFCDVGGVADNQDDRRREERQNSTGSGERNGTQGRSTGLDAGGDPSIMGDSGSQRLEGRLSRGSQPEGPVDRTGATDKLENARLPHRRQDQHPSNGHRQASGRDEGADQPRDRGPVNGFWQNANWVLTRPQRLGERVGVRPVEPGAFPLAHGVAARVGRLRGYGDSIVAPVAQAFIEAYMAGAE